jgi:hypothetical protein
MRFVKGAVACPALSAPLTERDPLRMGLELQTELVVINSQIAGATAAGAISCTSCATTPTYTLFATVIGKAVEP